MVKHSGSLLPLHIHQNAHCTQNKVRVSCHYLPYRSNKYLLKHCSLQQMDPVSSARFYNLLAGERDHPQKRKALKRTTCSFLSMDERGYNFKMCGFCPVRCGGQAHLEMYPKMSAVTFKGRHSAPAAPQRWACYQKAITEHLMDLCS